VAAQGETLGNENKKNMNPEGVQFQEWTLLLIRVAPFQGACFVGYLPRVSPWALLQIICRSVVSGFIAPTVLSASAPPDDTFIALFKQLSVEFAPLQLPVASGVSGYKPDHLRSTA